MRKKLPNLFIVAGDGRNSGKTSMVCRIIGQFRESEIVSVKISPHFHEPSAGLLFLESDDGYNIFGESSLWSAKDTSRMLQSGADKVFYAQVAETSTQVAFERILDHISPGKPIVVESPALIRYFDPGAFVIMRGSEKPDKEISEIEKFPHVSYTIEELDGTERLPVLLSEDGWRIR